MRFKHPPPETARVGTRRTTRVFLYFPRTVGNETRWMEEASILQECQLGPDPFVQGLDSLRWVDLAWAEKSTTR